LGPGTIRTAARDIEILCPEERGEFCPSIYLDGQLDKAIGAASGTDLVAQLRPVINRNVIHAPTIAYHIEKAVLTNGSVYSGNMKYFLYPKPPKSTKTSPVHMKTAALVSTKLGTQFFGHWLKDDCTQYMLAGRHGAPLSVPPLYTRVDQHQYESLFSQNWSAATEARIDHLIIYQDFSQNSLKRHRYHVLTAAIRSRLAPKAAAFVYFKRGKTGIPRLIANEDEIIKTLYKKGFIVVDMASDTLETIITSLMDAKIVVTLEGSHLSHCWFSPENKSGVVTLQPPECFTSITKGWLDAVSARFGFVIGDRREGCTWFSVSEILKTVDLMVSDLAQPRSQLPR
jgi:hypothetical protein